MSRTPCVGVVHTCISSNHDKSMWPGDPVGPRSWAAKPPPGQVWEGLGYCRNITSDLPKSPSERAVIKVGM
ncbi:hypothetical protein UVI_02014660 [Ustilaginoidea virens]|uniref:Uncharacterized protein n=1 Tax=Ustilaginoidea virens TaxID=1159556 RepID=A0A1B5L6P8_USTVR|nr:hypothetical protein UVI_02014660 [Ustilaginoidea virens]